MHLLFAWRYFKAKKSTNAINIIAWISIIAIIIGTAALILVLSAFNGFEGLVKSLYSSFYTDLKVTAASGKVITITQAQLDKIKGISGIKNFALVIEEKALLQNGEDYSSEVYVKGVDENYRYISGVADHLVEGEYDLGTTDVPKLILGYGVEGALGVRADRNVYTLKIYLPRKSREQGDSSTALYLDPSQKLLDDISNDTIRTSSAFQIQQDFDNKYVITNIGFLRKATRMGPEQYSAMEIALKDPSAIKNVSKMVKQIFGDGYLVRDKYEQNQSLYSIMNLERWVIYGVLCLILIVAAFNMIGALTMLVLEKQKDIGVLHALGGSQNFIKKIFLTEGLLLASIGAGVGMLLALLFVWLQIKFHLIPLEGNSFLVDYYPVQLKLGDFLLVGATVFIIALIASYLPSKKAANQQFSLRSE